MISVRCLRLDTAGNRGFSGARIVPGADAWRERETSMRLDPDGWLVRRNVADATIMKTRMRLRSHIGGGVCLSERNEKKCQKLGKFHSPRKVDNSFLGRATAYQHCPLCSSLAHRLWLTQLSHGVRPFPTVNRAKSFPALFRLGSRSALCLRACLVQIADDYAHMRTTPACPDPPGHGRWRAAVAKRN